MTYRQIIKTLEALANPANVAGMARYGISPVGTLGVPMPVLRRMGKAIGRRHDLADELWRSAIHESRILAALIDDPGKVTDDQMESWALDSKPILFPNEALLPRWGLPITRRYAISLMGDGR